MEPTSRVMTTAILALTPFASAIAALMRRGVGCRAAARWCVVWTGCLGIVHGEDGERDQRAQHDHHDGHAHEPDRVHHQLGSQPAGATWCACANSCAGQSANDRCHGCGHATKPSPTSSGEAGGMCAQMLQSAGLIMAASVPGGPTNRQATTSAS